MDINRDRERCYQIAPESCTIDQCEKWVWQSSKPQKVSQTGDESAGRLAQSYGVLAPTVSPFYHKLTTLLIEEEEEEAATGMPFLSTAWQQYLLLVLDLSNFYQIQPIACKPPNPSLFLSFCDFFSTPHSWISSLGFIFSNDLSSSPCLYFFSCVIHSFCRLFSSLWVWGFFPLRMSFILAWGSSSLLLLHKFEIFAHCKFWEQRLLGVA